MFGTFFMLSNSRSYFHLRAVRATLAHIENSNNYSALQNSFCSKKKISQIVEYLSPKKEKKKKRKLSVLYLKDLTAFFLDIIESVLFFLVKPNTNDTV